MSALRATRSRYASGVLLVLTRCVAQLHVQLGEKRLYTHVVHGQPFLEDLLTYHPAKRLIMTLDKASRLRARRRARHFTARCPRRSLRRPPTRSSGCAGRTAAFGAPSANVVITAAVLRPLAVRSDLTLDEKANQVFITFMAKDAVRAEPRARSP
jgi:hypothetical protein